MQKQLSKAESQIESFLYRRMEQGTLRKLKQASSAWIDFCSNDYLGFSKDRSLELQVNRAYQNLIEAMPLKSPILGSSGSRLLSGNHFFVEELETKIAAFHGAEAGLILSNGYLANLALLSTVIGKKDGVLIDEEAHASIWEGVKQSGANSFSFKHNNLASLRTQLEVCAKKYHQLFICIQTVYSTSGDLAPLSEIAALANEFSALLIADEAHATGVFGPQGEGLIVQEKLPHCFFARMHTFGKALGAYGAIILTNAKTKQFLINTAKPFIYSTAMPLYNYVLIDQAYQHMIAAEDKRRKLRALIEYCSQSAINCKLSRAPSQSPIQSVRVESISKADELSFELGQRGFHLLPLKPPTTRKNKVYLRICLHAGNTYSEIDQLHQFLKMKLGHETFKEEKR